MSGSVKAIFIAGEISGPVVEIDEVKAVAGKGLEGDRKYSENPDRPGRQITLIESEAIEAAEKDYGVKVGLGGSRRNIVTEGVALNHLVGREFTVGDVRVRGVKLCEPCSHLASLLDQKGVIRALIHRGGLRADILNDGVIRTGDPIQ